MKQKRTKEEKIPSTPGFELQVTQCHIQNSYYSVDKLRDDVLLLCHYAAATTVAD